MSGRLKRFAVAAVGLGLSMTTGCAGFFVYPGSSGNGSGSSGNYVYVANSTTGSNSTVGSLAGFTVGTGTLTAVTNSPYALSFVPTAVAVNPANTIVFVAGNSSIYAFSIGTGGSLTALNSGSAVGNADVSSMDISPDGQWLLALDGIGAWVDEFQINSTTGVLTQEPVTLYSISGGGTVHPMAIKVAPNGQMVFAALGTAGDLEFTFNTSTGALASNLQITFTTTTSDNALAVSPDSAYLYIARSGTNGGLAMYSIGTLTPVSGSPFAAGNDPFSLVVNHAGTDVYVANQLDSTISGYSVSGGTLTSLGAAYTSGSSVDALVIDRTGDYLLAVARGGSPDLTMYSFDSGIAGKLDLSTASATGVDPAGPVAIALTH
jgi:6-phosphogluconolactonase